MEARIVSEIVQEVFGAEPIAIERMTVGRINVVYSVRLQDREVVVRMNENPFVMKGTSQNISILAQLGIPVPRVIMEDLTRERHPFHYMILEKIPGRDLGQEIGDMTREQMAQLAQTIVYYQKLVAKLPLGSGYGWVPIGDKGEVPSWSDLIRNDFNNGLSNVQKVLSSVEIDRIIQGLDSLMPYLDRIQPVCFLDDVTTKNVIMLNGELQGIVDLDCVCYGDPLYMISLTQTAICADDMDESYLYYIDELCRAWDLTVDQRRIVDFYSLIFAMNFLAYFGDDVSGYDRMLSRIKLWTATLKQ